jgi:hypothetical protein
MFKSINKLLRGEMHGYEPLVDYDQLERERQEKIYRESLSNPVHRVNNNENYLEEALKAIPVPKLCDRCRNQPPKIRVKDKSEGTLEFICYVCRKSDNLLNKLPVQKKFK